MNTRLRISHHQKLTPPEYMDLEEQIKPFAKETAFRWSRKGVPHLLIELDSKIVYSLCYFKKSKSWRVFYPYGEVTSQQRQDFHSIGEILEFLNKAHAVGTTGIPKEETKQ